MKSLITVISIGSLIFMSSCFDDLSGKIDKIDSSNWNPEFAAPILQGDFTMGELANELSSENLIITANNEGVTTLIYHQPPIVSQTAKELITFDLFEFNERLNLGTNVASLPSVNQVISFSTDYRESFSSIENDKLYLVELNEGDLSINLSGGIPASGNITFVFHSLVKDGQKLELNYTWTNTTSQSYTNDIDLAGYTLDLSEGNTSYNQFLYSSSISINYEGQSLSSTDGFDISLSINNLSFNYIEGNLTRRTITPEEQYFEFAFNDDVQRGDFFINEPAFHLSFHNSIGAPMQANIDYIQAESDANGTLALTGDVIADPIDLLYPTQAGEVETSELTIDETNSNLPDLIAFKTDSVRYAASGIVNPNSNNDRHFVTDSSRLDIDLVTEVPLHGYIHRLRLSEQYEFDGDFAKDVDNAIINIRGSNSLAADARIQAYFLDEANTILDSLIYDRELLINAAIPDANGDVATPGTIDKSIALDNTRLDKIERATEILLVAILNTPQSPDQSVKFYEKNTLNIKLSGQTKFNVDF
ncbi:MAG: hypothetical protein N4A71_21650 [Carboxylicivirga sp.]|jgi:hypothetical protein|nr:hypothetical protein [Carboxylicivirga sp.]